MLLKNTDFSKRFVTIPITNMSSKPKLTDPQHLMLPNDAMIHFVSDSDSQLGIDKSHCLLRNALSQTYIYHVTNIKHELGNISPTGINPVSLIRAYQRTHLDIKNVTNLDRSISTNHSPIVMNYGLLPRLYKYSANNLLVYQEWYNIRNTMWDNISQVSLRREHFIRYKLPQILPTKSELSKYLEDFKASGLSEFHTNEAFDLLELWRMIHPDVVSPINFLPDDAIEHINLVFVENGLVAIIRLEDLVEMTHEDPIAIASTLYKFFDILVSLRSPIDNKVLDKETKDEEHVNLDDNSTIHKLIKEHAEAGNLSEAEQRGLLKLSQRYKTIKDPKGSGLTLEQLVPTKEDLRIDHTQVIADNSVITDKSMLTSTVQELEQKYVDKVLHKDIVQSILMLQNAGIIVKDLKTKRKVDCANKMDEYSVSLQPIAGEASTIHFTIPVINPDGSFKSGGVLYRADRQKSQVPIVKSKPNTVALSSYYGKIFVTRTETAINNYAKWIFKQISKIADDKDDNRITNLIYGINSINVKNIPRDYTAVSESIDSFIINSKLDEKNTIQYQMYFGYNKIPNLFTKEEIKKAIDNEVILCGRHIDTSLPLAMDTDGKIYAFIKDNKIELLGSLPYIIDPDLGEGPIEYTEFSLLNDRCPAIMALCYIYGLDKTLNDLNIKFRLEATNVRLPYNPNEYKLKFKDIVYVIDISNKYRKLLVGGFNVLKNTSNKYKGSDFNNQAVYGSIFHSFGLAVYQLRELKLLWDMFIEPITKGLLEEMGQPTTFRELLLHASDLLVDDFIPDTNNTRYKGYERLCGIMYRELVNAVRTHRSQGVMTNVGVTMNPRAVQLSILRDQTIGLVEESNPIQNIKEKESFTHSGSGGRNTQTMVKNTRGFTEKDLGVISEATPDSGKVGVRAYLTPNANITSIRGTTREFDPSKDGPASAISSTSLLSPACTHDAAARVI